jgi:hypothetical protein
MISIIKDIIDVAKALFGLKESLAKAEQQKREEMAKYFNSISVCLAETYSKLSDNIIPHDRCAELLSYGNSLPDTIGEFIGKKKSEELSELLIRSHKVEGLWEEFKDHPEKRIQLPIIAEASGIFLALSNSVRVGYKNED